MSQSKGTFNILYKKAEKPEDLPWFEADPPPLLVESLDEREARGIAPGRALDVGCGAGPNSIYMARRGYQVTGIDFMPQAVAIAQQQAQQHGLDIEFTQADVGQWQAEHPYDVVLDIGCLHTPGTIDIADYKRQLLSWLAPGGDFILLHVGRRGWWDKWPIGPSRIYSESIMGHFAPELEVVKFLPRLSEDMPIWVGGSALVGQFWFRRK
jgi:SAM-dependent methyltransferase